MRHSSRPLSKQQQRFVDAVNLVGRHRPAPATWSSEEEGARIAAKVAEAEEGSVMQKLGVTRRTVRRIHKSLASRFISTARQRHGMRFYEVNRSFLPRSV